MYRLFEFTLPRVPQGSIFGPLLLNVFLNNPILFLNNSDLHNFADYYTRNATCKNLDNLQNNLEKEAEQVIHWFNNYHMIAKTGKFQLIIHSKTDSSVSHNEMYVIITQKRVNQ